MLEHNAPLKSQARSPRGAVLVNDVLVPWESWDVESNATFDADTFRVSIPTSALPASTPVRTWLDGSALRVEIRAGFPVDPKRFTASELDSLIIGRTDDVSFNPVRGSIELTGRDFTGLLIDRKTTEKFANMTASQIVDVLASRVGLLPVTTETATKAGSYYDIDHARLTESMSEWDLLCWLAHEEGFMVFVRGTELHFQPKPTDQGSPYVLRWQNGNGGPNSFGGTNLTLTRNLTVAKDVSVTVRSWQSKKKTVILATYPRSKAKSAAPGTSGKTQPNSYVFNVPELSYEAAIQKAQSLHAEITAHEMKLSATLPADNLLQIDTSIQLQGTETPFDQTYFPVSINRHMAITDGYSMTVSANSRAPDTQATL